MDRFRSLILPAPNPLPVQFSHISHTPRSPLPGEPSCGPICHFSPDTRRLPSAAATAHLSGDPLPLPPCRNDYDSCFFRATAAAAVARTESQLLLPGEPSQPLSPGEPSRMLSPGEPRQLLSPGEPSQPLLPGQPSQLLLPGQPCQQLLPGEPWQLLSPGEMP